MATKSVAADPDEIEPAIKAALERTLQKRARGPYSACSDQQVREGLERLFSAEGHCNLAIMDLRRLAGGASKEMFCFSLRHDGLEEPERLVLRMDPFESIIETSRRREAEIIRAVCGTLLVPEVRHLDDEGRFLGPSSVITSFVPGMELCLVHADYRMGNFMFDERSSEMTAVLDWELAHIGDFHEDVAYVTQKLFGLVNERASSVFHEVKPIRDQSGVGNKISSSTPSHS